MTHEEKKVGKIVEELTMYFFTVGADDIQTGIQRKGSQAIITFQANYLPEFEYKIQKLKGYLNEPKNVGIEDIYWELAGIGDPGESSQLMLVGMMLDKAEVRIEDGHVCLTLYKELLEG